MAPSAAHTYARRHPTTRSPFSASEDRQDRVYHQQTPARIFAYLDDGTPLPVAETFCPHLAGAMAKAVIELHAPPPSSKPRGLP